jgi:hypothetical protein
MQPFGIVPPEVPVTRTLDGCAPRFASAITTMMARLAGGLDERVFETLRTEDRQRFLYGFGRTYDDGRGKVTNARTHLKSWHGFGLAADVVEKDATPWAAPVTFWNTMGEAAEACGLAWGGRWSKPDLPHVYWGKCPATPTEADRTLYVTEGIEAVWRKYGAFP